MTKTTRRTLLAVLALLAAAPPPAAAQADWRNPYTGRSFNNPGSSLVDTLLQNEQWRRMLAPPQPGAAPAAPRSASADPSFRLTNRGTVTINELYVSSAQSDRWGPDRLGQGVLAGGQSVILRLQAGLCLNDIRAVYANGEVSERRGIDTCAITDLTLP